MVVTYCILQDIFYICVEAMGIPFAEYMLANWHACMCYHTNVEYKAEIEVGMAPSIALIELIVPNLHTNHGTKINETWGLHKLI